MAGDRSRVPAIDATVRVLRFLGGSREGVGVSEVGRTCRLSKSTAHGIIKALEAHRFVVAVDGTKRYRLGPGLLEIVRSMQGTHMAVLVARPHLEALAQRLQLTCFLVVPYSAKEFLVLEKAESSQPIKVTVSVGERFPLTAGSLGKAYLAWRSRAEVLEVVRMVPLPRRAKAIQSTRAYLAELAKVRRQRFAESYEEYQVGNHALAAPVFDDRGRVTLLLLTVGFAADMPATRMRECGRLLRDAADRVTQLLGGQTPDVPERAYRRKQARA